MLKKIFLPCLFLLLGVSNSFSQGELTMPFLRSVYQSSYMNPAVQPDHKFSIGLPIISSIYAGGTSSGFKIKDLITDRSNDTLRLSINNAIEHLDKKNYFYTGVTTDYFHIRFKAKKNFFSFHINNNLNARFAFPSDFVKFLWMGNGAFIGKTIDLSKLGFDLNHYNEYAFGFSRYNEKKRISYGIRVKFLQGLANINFKNKDLSLYTDADMYHLKLVSNGVVNTSLPFNIEDGEYNELNGYLTNFKNKGAGIDLGVDYQVTDKFSVAGSLTNIGFINWRTNVHNYSLTGSANFDGLDPKNELYSDSSNLDNYVDSLQNRFEFKKTKNNYTTWLPPRLYLNARYKLWRNSEAAFGAYFEKYQVIRPGFSLSLSQKVGKWFEGIASYSYQYKSFRNIGLGVMFKPGPVQFYFAADNPFTLIEIDKISFKDHDRTLIFPINGKTVNFRFGMNIVLGRIRTQEKQPLPQE